MPDADPRDARIAELERQSAELAAEIQRLTASAAADHVALDQTQTRLRAGEDRLRRAHDTFFHVIENNPFGILVVDADFRLQQVSLGARRTFEGISPLVGRDFDEVLRLVWPAPFVDEALARFRHTLATGEPYVARGTIERRADTGRVEAYDWRVEPIELPDGRHGVVCYFYDLSERQRWEAALLERERELRHAEATLRDADRRKDEFLAILAHELRNLLAPVRTGLELLRPVAAAAETSAKALVVMDRQLGHLVRLVDDLLDVARIGRGAVELERERLPVQTIVEHAVEASRPLLVAGGHTLTVELPDAPLGVHGDLTRLAQAVGNLLNNAAKYTPPGGRIGLSAAVEGDDVVLRVTDDGIGIAADMLPKVFDLFAQVEGTLDRAQGGLGIGLALVRRLLELHGGTVEAHSHGHGHGSTFTVRLPLAPAGREAAPPPPGTAAAPPRPSGRRVLVVDDNADAAEIIALLLEVAGHETKVAGSGPAALELAQAWHPEVALLDIGLPGMDGYELARRLRALPATAHAFLVALTGWGSDDVKQVGKEAGFDLHLVKPVGPDVVADAVARASQREPRG